jgi:hypothetical protein
VKVLWCQQGFCGLIETAETDPTGLQTIISNEAILIKIMKATWKQEEKGITIFETMK